MSSLYKMSGSYRVRMTASHWVDSYNDLKSLTEPSTPQRKKSGTVRSRERHAPKASATPRDTRH